MNKTIAYLKYIIQRQAWRLAAVALVTAQTAAAQSTGQQSWQTYTASDPLVIAIDWDFPPLEYSNSNGNPDGYHTEVLSIILDELKIPHKFVMNSRSQCIQAFNNREADLIFSYGFRYRSTEYVRSRNIFHYYRLKVAKLKETPPITSIEQQSHNETIVVNSNNDSITAHILKQKFPNARFEYHSPREALTGIANGTYKYFIWGEAPLKWKINELGIEGLVLSDFKTEDAEVHLVGYDKGLMNEIDNQFARLEQRGEISQLITKWFYPENMAEQASMTVVYITLGLTLAIILLYVVYRFSKARVRSLIRKNQETEAMMHTALSMDDFSVMVMSLHEKMVRNLHGHIVPDEGMNQETFLNHIHPADTSEIRKKLNLLTNGTSNEESINLRWNAGKPEHPVWRIIQGNAIAEIGIEGKVSDIIITTRDITSESQIEQNEQQVAGRYFKMFESTLVGISFYDKDGFLIELNDKMREIACIKPESEAFYRRLSMFDADLVKGAYPKGSCHMFHTCQRMYYPEAGVNTYIEFRITPIINYKGVLEYYVLTARDISQERNIYLEMRRHAKAIEKASDEINTYEKRLRMMLESCHMYVWRSDLATGILHMAQSLRSKQYQETMEEYINSLYEDHRQIARERLSRIIENRESINVLHHFHITPVTDGPAWFLISGVPVFDENGKITQIFGIARDVSDLMEIQEQLKRETERANDSGRQKSAFLANMTHEIRTPLNAIVGFSDLLHDINDPGDRKEFIRIIRNNCDMLLRLINDIFEASTMDSNPIAIEKERIDFAISFGDICQSLAQRVQEPSVEFITENPYEHLIAVIDQGRMQQVLTNFVTNAVKYTHQGHIRVGYRLTGQEKENEDTLPDIGQFKEPGLYMFCEDTGAGIPADKQQSVFERFVKLNDFVQGTGLGLSICKSIAERCGGHIGVSSQGEGLGSTFWFWIPCEIIDSKEKTAS